MRRREGSGTPSGERLRGSGWPFAERLRTALEAEEVDVPVEEMWKAIAAARAVEVPVEEMWEAIVAGRRADAPAVDRGGRREAARSPGRRNASRAGGGPALGATVLAAAAVAAVAFGLERAPDIPRAAVPTPLPTAVQGPGPYATEVAGHFREAETLLTLFRTGPGDVSAETRRWARSLLGSTRLFMDSPVHDDPELAGTLDDLELVLVQIASLGERSTAAERRWVEESLQHRRLMTKLRTMGLDTDGPFTTMEDE